MKKLMLLFAMVFTFATIASANPKNNEIKKESVKKKSTMVYKAKENENEAGEKCIYIISVREWDGEQFGPAHPDVLIDWNCIRRLFPFLTF